MVQALLVALAVLAIFTPGVILFMYYEKMPRDTRRILVMVWLLCVSTVFFAVDMIKG